MSDNEDICSSTSHLPEPGPTEARPYIPTLAVTSPANYGSIDAENESNLHILNGLQGPNAARKVQAKFDSCSSSKDRNPRKRPHSPERNMTLGML